MKKILFAFCAVALLIACSGDGGGSSQGDSYDRTALLTNWADNIIIPSFENYQAKVNTLVANTTAFTATPSEANLQTLRASWLEAYKAFQYVSMYALGKAEEISFKESTNTYPSNASGIDAMIADGNYNLIPFSSFDKQGFPGMDYLINGLGINDADILEFYTTNANASNYKQFLTTVSDRLKTRIDLVVADWKGSFREIYIADNSQKINSAVNKTTNLFVKNIEKDIRTGKLGIPAGLFSGGMKYPEKVEGFYKNDISKELLNLSLKATQDFFNGKHFGSATNGVSLKSYLDYVNADRDGQKLSDIINNQFTAVFTANDGLNNSFSEQIFSDNSKMITAYDALQQNVVYTKLDMLQALGITIDYVDGDGD